jgi:hypothetical protein
MSCNKVFILVVSFKDVRVSTVCIVSLLVIILGSDILSNNFSHCVLLFVVAVRQCAGITTRGVCVLRLNPQP